MHETRLHGPEAILHCDEKRSEWIQLKLLAVIVLSMWVLSVQTLKAQCNAGNFVPPTFLHTTPNGTVMSFIQDLDGKHTISGLFSSRR